MHQLLSLKENQPTVVGAGFIALDVLSASGASHLALGGSAGNVLAILAYLGWNSLPVAQLGADPASARIEEEFDALGAETSFLRREGRRSTPVVYQTIADGRPSYSFACPVCGDRPISSELDAADLVEEVKNRVRSPAVFFFDRASSMNAVLAEHFRRLGGLVIFEPSTASGTDEFKRCLTSSHVVKYAEDRISALPSVGAGEGDYVEIQTLGAAGLRFRMPHSTRWTQSPSIPAPFVADTSGSGDWCTAGAMYWFLQHGLNRIRPSTRSVRAALRFGQALASMNCMYEGARSMANHAAPEALLATAERLSARPNDPDVDAVAGLPTLACWQASELGPEHESLCCKQLLG